MARAVWKNMSANAFHEKAGRSQEDSVCFSLDKGFSPAESPLTPSFHPHSRGAIWSLGASWAFSFQPVLPPDFRPAVPLQEWNLGQAFNAVTGTRLWLLSFFLVERFCFCFCRLFLGSCGYGR